MSVSRERALGLRAVYGVESFAADTDLDAMLMDRRMPVVRVKWSDLDPLPEAVIAGKLHLRRGQARSWDRWGKAEGLGHAVLHVGRQSEMPERFIAYQERQVQEFAGWLIFGEMSDYRRGPFTVTFRTIAEAAAVPTRCVERWWTIVGGEWDQYARYA